VHHHFVGARAGLVVRAVLVAEALVDGCLLPQRLQAVLQVRDAPRGEWPDGWDPLPVVHGTLPAVNSGCG